MHAHIARKSMYVTRFATGFTNSSAGWQIMEANHDVFIVYKIMRVLTAFALPLLSGFPSKALFFIAFSPGRLVYFGYNIRNFNLPQISALLNFTQDAPSRVI